MVRLADGFARAAVYLIKNEQGEDFFLYSDGELESACFTGQIPLRATFIGGDLDAANAFSLWGMRWALATFLPAGSVGMHRVAKLPKTPSLWRRLPP